MSNLLLKKQLFPQLKQALNPERSQSFGRQLYQVSIDDLDYWLKLQIPLVSDLHESSFLNEINRYQMIDHLKIAITAPHQILDFSQDEQSSFNILGQGLLVLTCEALFKRNPNDMLLKDIVAVLMKSLSVIERLHAMGWIHGDLKSEHFRMYQGRAVLIDLEQVIDLNQAFSDPNTATPRYMAPELFHSAPKSFASDIYALGIIWLEWLNQDKLTAKSYIEWAKLHCQTLKIELDDPFSVFSPVLTLLLNKNKSVRCTNFYQIKHILSRIV